MQKYAKIYGLRNHVVVWLRSTKKDTPDRISPEFKHILILKPETKCRKYSVFTIEKASNAISYQCFKSSADFIPDSTHL